MSSPYLPYGGMPGKPCARCGRPLPTQEVYCSNCGYYNAPPQGSGSVKLPSNASWGSNVPQTGQHSNQTWAQPPTSPASPAPSAPVPQGGAYEQPFSPPKMFRLPSHSSSPNNIYPNGNASGPQPASVPLPTAGAQPISAPLPMSGSQPIIKTGNRSGLLSQAMQNGGYYSPSPMQPPPQPQPPTYLPAPPPAPVPVTTGGFQTGSFSNTVSRDLSDPFGEKSGPNIPVLIGIVITLVVLVGGGALGYLFFSHHGMGNTTSSTAVRPTPTPKVPPLFADTFANNTNGWDLQGEPGKFSVAIANSSLSLEDDDNKLLWELLPGGKTFSDFHLLVDAVLSKGDQNNGYGIYIRGASNQNTDLATYYRFELYGDGTYAVFKGVVDATGNSTSVKLVDYTATDAIHAQGKVNHIDIIAKGSSMTLMVNGQVLKTVTDSSYTGGSIALFVSNLQGSRPGAQATFSHFAIYPANV